MLEQLPLMFWGATALCENSPADLQLWNDLQNYHSGHIPLTTIIQTYLQICGLVLAWKDATDVQRSHSIEYKKETCRSAGLQWFTKLPLRPSTTDNNNANRSADLQVGSGLPQWHRGLVPLTTIIQTCLQVSKGLLCVPVMANISHDLLENTLHGTGLLFDSDEAWWRCFLVSYILDRFP